MSRGGVSFPPLLSQEFKPRGCDLKVIARVILSVQAVKPPVPEPATPGEQKLKGQASPGPGEAQAEGGVW